MRFCTSRSQCAEVDKDKGRWYVIGVVERVVDGAVEDERCVST